MIHKQRLNCCIKCQSSSIFNMDNIEKPLNYPSFFINITRAKSQLFSLVHIIRFINKYCKIIITKVFHNKSSGFFGTTVDELFCIVGAVIRLFLGELFRTILLISSKFPLANLKVKGIFLYYVIFHFHQV